MKKIFIIFVSIVSLSEAGSIKMCSKLAEKLTGMKKVDLHIQKRKEAVSEELDKIEKESEYFGLIREKLDEEFRKSSAYKDYYEMQVFRSPFYKMVVDEITRSWSLSFGFHYKVKVMFLYSLREYFESSQMASFRISKNLEIINAEFSKLIDDEKKYRRVRSNFTFPSVIGHEKDGGVIETI